MEYGVPRFLDSDSFLGLYWTLVISFTLIAPKAGALHWQHGDDHDTSC